jgi:uncharacterized protein YlxP (DUF503 family)
MSGKSEKKIRKVFKHNLKFNFRTFVNEVRSYELWDRMTISFALIFKSDNVFLNQTYFWLCAICLFLLGLLVGWRI